MWKELNLKQATLNFSKVTPYDDTLSVLNSKKGYYHNNRLTALKKWTTDAAVGYKCYKRQANANNLVDGELTDYIEINKITESGAVVHMMDVADSYYKNELISKYDDSITQTFDDYLYIEGIPVGSGLTYYGWTFLKLPNGNFLAVDKNKYIYIWKKTDNFQTKVSLNKKIDETYIVMADNNQSMYLYSADDISNINTYANDNVVYSYEDPSKGSHSLSVSKFDFSTFSLGVEIFSYTAIYIPLSLIHTDGEEVDYQTRTFFTPLAKYQVYEHRRYEKADSSFIVWSKFTIKRTDFMTRTVESWTAEKERRCVNSLASYYPKTTLTTALPTITTTTGSLINSATLTETFKEVIQGENGGSNTSSSYAFVNAFDKSQTTSFSGIDNSSTKFQLSDNPSIKLNNGMWLNFCNKEQVTVGHNYKIIVRVDTQGATCLGSDNTYVYVKQLNNIYRISIENGMFPDKNYGDEVNIIESDFCKQVGGYKIFNTTTYYNAVYNDDPDCVICSCDDWNGRFYQTFTTVDPDYVVQMTSRIGNQALSQSSEIPYKVISDELSKFRSYNGNRSFSWINSEYTIHSGTKAYIYANDNAEEDTIYRHYLIYNQVFTSDVDNTDIFNTVGYLVPSILFCNFLKSDVVNVIQIGSEAYELLNYSYSPATPALEYKEEAISINVDPTSEEMVIQGAYYTIGGALSARKILNPYDTSTSTYCCDVTGLKYIGYDSEQGYFYSPATGVIYTFNGANKLNAYLEVDKRIPLYSGEKDGITVANIPSINLIAMAFTDGVLIILNGQSIFIPVQSVNVFSTDNEHGLIKINGSYYYFSTNTVVSAIIEDDTTGSSSTEEIELETCKIGTDWLTNVTADKLRFIVFFDRDSTLDTDFKVEFTTNQNNTDMKQTVTKHLTMKDFKNGYSQFELTPKYTKGNYFSFKVNSAVDIVACYINFEENSEENVIR